MADGDGPIRQSLSIDRDAEGSSGFIHAAIAPADGAAVVVKAGELLPKIVVQRGGELGHSVLLHQRKDSGLDRGEAGRESQYHACLALDFLLPVCVNQQSQSHPIGSRGCLDDVREVALILRLVEILELLARVLLVPAQIEVPSVVNTFDLLPTEGKLILDVVCSLGVVGQLASAVLVPLKLRGIETERSVPVHSPFAPTLEPQLIGTRLHEELHLHLFEFAGAEDKVSRCDLVPKCLADLRDPEWNSLA